MSEQSHDQPSHGQQNHRRQSHDEGAATGSRGSRGSSSAGSTAAGSTPVSATPATGASRRSPIRAAGSSIREAAGGYGTRGADSLAATVTAYLVGGPAVYGFLGWLADRWLGTAFLLPVGVVGGMALSLYIVWLRYGKP